MSQPEPQVAPQMPDMPNVPAPMMQIDDKQYPMSDLTPEQHSFAAQIKDLEAQLRDNEFKHQQLIFSRTAYITALKDSLENPDGNEPERPE